MHRRVQFFLATALVTTIVWLCTFNGSGALGLIGPDEPRYAAVAREMATDGDWKLSEHISQSPLGAGPQGDTIIFENYGEQSHLSIRMHGSGDWQHP